MIKWKLPWIAVIAALLLLSACSGNDQAGQNDPANEAAPQQEAGDNEGNHTDENEGTLAEPPVAEPLPDDAEGEGSDPNADASTEPAALPFTVAELEAGMSIGMTQEEVIELIGENYAEVTIAMDNTEGWRYDIGAAEDYSLEETMDFVDIEGIKRGDVPLQIFVSFDSASTVYGYSAYQLEDDGSITVYQWFENGESKTDTIQ